MQRYILILLDKKNQYIHKRYTFADDTKKFDQIKKYMAGRGAQAATRGHAKKSNDT